jgi:hyperosmotically inducible periplasmic protein
MTAPAAEGRTPEPPGPCSALNASNVSRCYPRQREYPHPPPPSKNKTRRIINMVVISHLSSLQCRAGWGPKLNLRRTAPVRLSRCGVIRSHDRIGSWQEPHRRASTRKPDGGRSVALPLCLAEIAVYWCRPTRWLFISIVWVSRSPVTRRLGIRMQTISRMNFYQVPKTSVITLALLLGACWVVHVNGQSADDRSKPDNTAVNKGDGSRGAITADQQKMNAADRKITAKIRRSIMADKSLSMYAHNVKIISQDGTVTLKGPVRSDEEVQSILSRAADVTGSADKVINQMSVKVTSQP